jgi:2-oxoisovalerate dehydrogenase E1 component
MFPDFALVAADQLFNQIGKLRHMYNNTTEMPVVVRTRIAIGCGYGGQHSMDPGGLFSLFSGWRIVAPSNSFDYIGLFNSAYTCNDPVLIIEHHGLYGLESTVPKGNLDYFVELGKAKKVKEGKDVTVLCYGFAVNMALQVAQALNPEINAEIIDLRTISPNDIDYETIGQSLKKTNAMIIVEQAPASMGISNYIINKCQELFFDYLDAPIISVKGKDVPNPVSKVLEASCVPDPEAIKDAITKMAKRQY